MIRSANFPTTVWNQLTNTHLKTTDDIHPDRFDWEQIAAEVAAIEQWIVGTRAPVLVTASGAIPPSTVATYLITKAGVAAMTLAAPVATTDDGKIIRVVSGTAFAHTITATGLLNVGTAAVNLATFAAFAGAGVELMAYQAKWYALASVAITFS